MEHNYKYISENCQEELSLHDCLCSHLYFQDDRLIHPEIAFPHICTSFSREKAALAGLVEGSSISIC